jgi:hypothetical protein
MSTHVYIANSLNQDVYVLPAEKTGWLLGDVGFSVALLATGATEIRLLGMASELPTALRTVRDLFIFLRIMSGTYGSAQNISKFSQQVVDQVKNNAIKIPAGQVVDVLDQGFLSTYTSLSGVIGQIFSADTFNLLVMTDDGKQVALASTNPDYSWIVQGDRLVRSAYGASPWQADPGAGVYLFNAGDFVPPGSYQQTCKDIHVTLTCSAKARNGSAHRASFDLTAHSSDVSLSNVDGSLVVDNDTASANGFVPGGSYTQTCSEIKVELTCQAQKGDMTYQAASLDLTNFESADVSNNNGVLVNES